MENKFSDEKLVELIKQGEVISFEHLVVRYQKRLVNFSFRITGIKEMAEDIVQESLVKVYKNIDKVNTSKKFSTFIFEITKNTAIDYIRKSKKEISLENIVLYDEEVDIYDRMSSDEETRNLKSALKKIDERYRIILTLYYFDDLSYDKIASKLKLPINTVRTHLRRAKEKLKSELAK
jgi:RNA polymerase sigma-70 factor, ECF subfamily